MDTTAQAPRGKLCRAGRVRRPPALRACAPACPSGADGGLLPHGLDDRGRTRGPLNLGWSPDPRQVAGDRGRWSGHRLGTRCDPQATSLRGRCDWGGSNAAHTDLCTHAWPRRAEQLGVAMRVAHAPSEGSTDHVMERRRCPQSTRACQGLVCDTLDTVGTLRRTAATSPGLRTTVTVRRRHDETGRKATEHRQQNVNIVFDHLLPQWH
jgi:hypothetical protein